jgi:hypothetical protein
MTFGGPRPTLHCYGYPLGRGVWRNRCVDLYLTATGASFTDAEQALDALILRKTLSGQLRVEPAPLRHWAAYYAVKLLNRPLTVLVRHWRHAGAVGVRLLTRVCAETERIRLPAR